MVNKVTLATRALAVSFCLVAGSTAAHAGKLFISGHDSDDSGHVSVAFGRQMLDFIGTGNTNGGSGILILGGYTSTSAFNINTWNNSGVPYTITHASGAAAISAQSFASFAAILMPSAITQTGGGISQAELDAINGRALDIANFVNAGGNLLAFTQQGLTDAFGWFPLGALQTTAIGTANISQTAELANAGFIATDAEITGDLYHNEFDGPAGFFGLKVLAVNNATGDATILGGGVGTTIIITDVPEPATLALLGAGLLGFGFVRRRKV